MKPCNIKINLVNKAMNNSAKYRFVFAFALVTYYTSTKRKFGAVTKFRNIENIVHISISAVFALHQKNAQRK